MRLIKFILSFALSLQLSSTSIAKDHPYGAEFTQKVESLLYENGQLSPAKLQAYIATILQKHEEYVGLTRDGQLVDNSVMGNKYRESGRSNKKVQEKLEEHEAHIILMQAVEALEKLDSKSTDAEVLTTVKFAMDMEDSLKRRGYPGIPRLAGKVLKGVLKRWKIPMESKASEEASNLYSPTAKRYLSENDIIAAKRSGTDLSLYDPTDSSFWQKQNISSIDVKKAAMGENLKLYKDAKIYFPENLTFTFDHVKQSDTKPKMEVYAKDSKGNKFKYKLKIGAELHSEPTAGALVATLGFPTDISKYAKNIKVYLGDSKFSELKKDWESYYTRDAYKFRYHIEDYIADSGFDRQKQQEYIIFKEGVLEARPKGVERHGRWHFAFNSNDTLREVRGLMMVQMWLDNPDVTDFRNNKLLLKEKADGTFEPYNIISDMGVTFGFIFGETPDAYRMKMVDSKTRNNIFIKYLSIDIDIKGELTYSDAKWAVRKIAQLTRKQITDAFAVGGWPKCVQDIYVEKVISRRNDLVQNFGLSKEYPLMPLRKTESELKFKVACNKEKLAEESTLDFEHTWSKITTPVARVVKDLSLNVAQGVMNGKRSFAIQNDEWGVDGNMVSEVIVDLKRLIEANPNAKTEQDLYVVKDHLEVGLRLGPKFGPFADLIYTKRYSLAYTARTRSEARLNNGFIGNVLLPFDIAKKNLPASFVIETGHTLDAGYGLRIEDKLSFLSPGIEIRNSGHVLLSRSVLKQVEGEDVVVFRDKTTYSQKIIEAFAKVAIIRIPVFEYVTKDRGRSEGQGVIVDRKSYDTDKALRDSIWKAMQDGDFSGLDKNVTNFQAENKFNSSSKSWNFLIWSGRSVKQLDDIKFTILGKEKSSLQYLNLKESSKGIIFFNETKRLQAAVYSNSDTKDRFQLELTFQGIDSDTKTKELSRSYIGFVNQLHPENKKVINFTPELGYTINKLWGPTMLSSQTIFYPEAVDKLIQLSPNDFWRAMASAMNISRAEIGSLVQRYRAYIDLKRKKSNLVTNRSIRDNLQITLDDVKTIRAAERFLNKIQEARQEDGKDKLRMVKHLANAMQKTKLSGLGFYDPIIVKALITHVGLENIYSQSIISGGRGGGGLVDGEVLKGSFGNEREDKMKYLNYQPTTAVGLYEIFDDLI